MAVLFLIVPFPWKYSGSRVFSWFFPAWESCEAATKWIAFTSSRLSHGGTVLDYSFSGKVPWSQRFFLIFPCVREPRSGECESRSGEKVSQDIKQFSTSGKNDINGTAISKETVFPCVDIGGEKCHKHWPNGRRSRPVLQRGIASRNNQEAPIRAFWKRLNQTSTV